jgi:hypothetical protein
MLTGDYDGSDRDHFCQEVRSADIKKENGRRWRPFFIGQSGRAAPGSLVEFPGRLFPLRASARPVAPALIVGRRGFPPGALVRSVLPIGGSQLDFELIDFIPLGVGSLALRYREEFLQAATGRFG